MNRKKLIIHKTAQVVRKSFTKAAMLKRRAWQSMVYGKSRKYLPENNIVCAPTDLYSLVASKSDYQITRMVYAAFTLASVPKGDFSYQVFVDRDFAAKWFMLRDYAYSGAALPHRLCASITSAERLELIEWGPVKTNRSMIKRKTKRANRTKLPSRLAAA